MKIAVNKCFGGFSLSDKAIEMIMKKKGLDCVRYKQIKYSWQDGINEYQKCISESNSDLFRYLYLTKDLGDKINDYPEELSWYYGYLERTDIDLISTIEELGADASGRFGNVKVVDIPDDIEWTIENYDGIETVEGVHRSW